MARRAHAPRTPDIDLPEPLEPISALAADGDRDGVVLAGADQSNRDLTGLRLTASRLADCDLHGARLARALLAECELNRVEASALDLVGARLRDVMFSRCRIGELRAHDVEMVRVAVRGSRLGYVNLRDAAVTDLRFERCAIADLDVGAASLERVAFDDCSIERLHTAHAELRDVDLSGASTGVIGDVGHLRGAVITSAQLVTLAPLLAEHLGITVRDGGRRAPERLSSARVASPDARDRPGRPA